jgi:hypothetical protein
MSVSTFDKRRVPFVCCHDKSKVHYRHCNEVLHEQSTKYFDHKSLDFSLYKLFQYKIIRPIDSRTFILREHSRV